MRSRAELRARVPWRARSPSVELALRLIGVAAILAWIVNALVPRAGGVTVAAVGDVGDALPGWTRDASVSALHVRLDTTPDAATSAWLAALRRAGTELTWSGDALRPVAIEAYTSADPSRGTIVLASADSGIVSDALGPIDTLSNATSLRLTSFQGTLTLSAGPHRARLAEYPPRAKRGGREPEVSERATAPLRAAQPSTVFLAGTANWEAKFLIAALEEAGWKVDARLFIAPGQAVVQGAGRASLDTARHSAVILLDSAAARNVSGVEAFVRNGGGAILAGNANRARSVSPLTAWRAGAGTTAPLGTLPGDSVWRGLSRIPLTVTEGRGLVLEQRGGTAAVVARRHYSGRVLGVGYDETWRWRMAGGENSVAEHRAWWNQLVSSVAMRPVTTIAMGAAPVAELHDVLGPPTDAAVSGAPTIPRSLLASLFGFVALLSLLAEWMLRRARGAR